MKVILMNEEDETDGDVNDASTISNGVTNI